MISVDELLGFEEERLENVRKSMYECYREIATPAIEQRPVEFRGETRMVDYIIFDKLSPEDREKLDYYSRILDDVAARKCVLENYIKSNVPEDVISEYNDYVEPIETYNGVRISCSAIDLDENREFTRTSIKVGDALVESPREMSVQEYNQLYTTALTSMLSNGLTSQQAHDKIEEVCTDAYLAKRNLSEEMSL